MLGISPEKVCFIIVKTREFDVKVEPVIPDPGSNPSDDGELSVLSDYDDDPVYEELTSLMGALSEEEMSNLLALLWLGRGDIDLSEWEKGVRMATQSPDERRPRILLGIPLISDYLDKGLEMMGYSCS